MSALQDYSRLVTPLDQGLLQRMEEYFWAWFEQHRQDVVVKRKILFFSVTILVKDLKPLFEKLFGPEGAT